MTEEKCIDRFCLECGTKNLVAFYPGNSDEPLYYQCKECDTLYRDPDEYDRIYDEYIDEYLEELQEEFAEKKTREEKRELLDGILEARAGGKLGLNRVPDTVSVIILRPEVIPFYERITELSKSYNMYGNKETRKNRSHRWSEPKKPWMIDEMDFESVLKEVERFEEGQGLSARQERAKELLKENEKEKIGVILEQVFERVFDEEKLIVFARKIEKGYINDIQHSRLNNSYQLVFSIPERDVLEIKKYW